MGKAPCCDMSKVKRGSWSPKEDKTLRTYVEKNGIGGNWISLPQKAGLKRWQELPSPVAELSQTIYQTWRIHRRRRPLYLHSLPKIGKQLPGRTDNDVKNYWNTKLKKKVLGSSSKQTNVINNNINSSTTSRRKTGFVVDSSTNSPNQSNGRDGLSATSSSSITAIDNFHGVGVGEGGDDDGLLTMDFGQWVSSDLFNTCDFF